MRNLIRSIFTIVALLTILSINPSKAKAQGPSVSFQVFYDNLSPYGTWVEYPAYGYVWIPDAEPGFSPYSTGGYWVWTDFGWTWVSDYAWGWAPFHYGRWKYDGFYGWFWVPDYVWGPAWVCWRHSPGYYGWAPIEPGININVVIRGRYHPHHDYWCFMDEHYMGDRYGYQHYVPRTQNTVIINQSRVVRYTYRDKSRNSTYISGPRRTDVQKVTGKTVNRVEVVERTDPGHGVKDNKMDIYRPRVEKKEGTRPTKVEPIKNMPSEKDRNENYEKNKTRQQPQQNQPKIEPRQEPQQNQQKIEPRQQQNQPKIEPRQQPQQNQPKIEPRQQPQQNQPKIEPRQEPQQNQPKIEPRQQPQQNQPKIEPRQQPQQNQPKIEPRQQPQQNQPKIEPRQQPQQNQPKIEPRQQQQQNQPKIEPRQQPQQNQQRNQPRQNQQKIQPRQNQQKTQPQQRPQPNPNRVQPREKDKKE
jgi:hypothetical protein